MRVKIHAGGAPRIHGELLKLGINIGETSMSKYLVRRRKPPSQTWRTFLENHTQSLVSIDFSLSRQYGFRSCMCLSFRHTSDDVSFTPPSQRIRLRSGLLTSFAKHFLGTPRRNICCEIGIGSAARILLNK